MTTLKHLSWLKVTKLHAQKHSRHPIVNISSPQHFDLKTSVLDPYSVFRVLIWIFRVLIQIFRVLIGILWDLSRNFRILIRNFQVLIRIFRVLIRILLIEILNSTHY